MKSIASAAAFLSTAVSFSVMPSAHAQPKDVNYDEAKVPAYRLPDPLTTTIGARITTSQEWQQLRRPEVLRLFETHEYGRSPGRPKELTWEVTSVDRNAA